MHSGSRLTISAFRANLAMEAPVASLLFPTYHCLGGCKGAVLSEEEAEPGAMRLVVIQHQEWVPSTGLDTLRERAAIREAVLRCLSSEIGGEGVS